MQKTITVSIVALGFVMLIGAMPIAGKVFGNVPFVTSSVAHAADLGYDVSEGDWDWDFDYGYTPEEYDYDVSEGDWDWDFDYGGCSYDCYDDSCYDCGGYWEEDYGCYDCYSYYTPTYSTGCSWCGSSTPRYTAPSSSSYSSYYNSNTVTNTNVNNITNIDNSIRDSFNTIDSYNTSLVVAAPQTPVVYTPPVITYPAPYCTINHAQYGGYGSSAYLSWSSTNATSAYLSNVGSVGISGSQTVYPGSGMTYTLTVYGYNGQSTTCSTWVAGNTYVPPTYVPPVVHQPYVALTQIPYTGFDFGPIGNAMYWVALMSFAVAGAYLALYYRGGAFALAGAMIPNRTQKFAPVVAPKAPILVEKEAAIAAQVAPVVASIRKTGTTDTMAIFDRKDGSMPKIVINRS